MVYDASEETLEAIKDLGLDGLIVIGGDGTLSIANELHKPRRSYSGRAQDYR